MWLSRLHYLGHEVKPQEACGVSLESTEIRLAVGTCVHEQGQVG